MTNKVYSTWDDLFNNDEEVKRLQSENLSLRMRIADLEELLIEFRDNPNIELGEIGHEKISKILGDM